MRSRPTRFGEPTFEQVGDLLEMMGTLGAAGMTVAVVTHEMSFARETADELLVTTGGAVVETGPPPRVRCSPTDQRAQQFLARVLK
jgi:polar amino acid transport system ATP-binding protein